MSEQHRRPSASTPGPRTRPPAPTTEDGRWKRHRARKKARLAAMSRTKRIWRRVGLTVTWLLALFAVCLVVAAVAFYQFTRVPQPSDIKLAQQATFTYSDGTTMATIGTNRTTVALAKVPVDVRFAVLAAEDRGFYSESGVSIKGTIRAALNDLRGGDTQGGSGITQQYVKNAYLNADRTLSRKLRELAIAVKLDRDYSKDQILEWYLNTIYFGRGAYGIEAAAQAYFGVDVSKLSLSQGALLAGLIQAPSDYDPATAADLAQQRWNYVLDGLVSMKRLTTAQRATLTFPKTIAPTSRQLGGTGPEALIVRQVREELKTIGIDDATLNTGGLVIQTTINRAAQQSAETAISQVYGQLTPQQIADKLREAMVAIEPSTGAVLAYYGGSDGVGVDYAQAWRAPGSSFKPYTLAAVLQANLAKKPLTGTTPAYAINSIVDGTQPANLPDLPPIVNDPGDKSESYPQPITQAMKVSLNTAFARLAYAVGPNNVATAAHAAGIASVKTSTAYAAAGQKTLVGSNGQTDATIGFGSYAVRPIDQAVGFATIANGGTRNASYFISKVTDSAGKTLYKHNAAGIRAFDPRVANDVAISMNQVADWSHDGLDNGRSSGAKTGTVGIDCPSSAPSSLGCNSDAWMVGFTPQVSVAVWTGNDQTSVPALNKNGGPLYGSNMPGQAWKIFMDTYLANAPDLPVPTKQEIFNGSDSSTGPTTTAPSTTASSAPAPSTTATRPTTAPTTAPTTTRTTKPATPTTPVKTGLPVTPPVTPTKAAATTAPGR